MIVGNRKEFSEILEKLGTLRRVLVLGCNECVTVCGVGGEREVGVLASELRLFWQKEGETFEIREHTLERQCDCVGGDLRLSHPLKWQYTRLFWMYRYEYVKLTNLAPNPAQSIVEASKLHNTSATSFTLRRDSRDSLFAPTKGSDNSLGVEMAGVRGFTGEGVHGCIVPSKIVYVASCLLARCIAGDRI